MNRERDIERVLDAWLAQGPTVMTDRLFDDVLERIERQPQRRLARLQLRIATMRPITILAAAAAIAIAVGAGIVLLGRPATPDVAAPTAAPPVAPTATVAPSPAASPASVLPAELRHRWIGAPRAIDGLSDVVALPLLWMAEPLVSFNHNLGGRFLESEPMLGGQAAFSPDPTGTLEGRVTFVLRSSIIGGCAEGDVGSYSWRLSTDRMTLTLTAEGDACAVRANAFSGTWTRSDCRNPDDTCLGAVPAGTYASTFLDVRSEPGQVRSAGAFGQLRYTVPDGWANMDDWPDDYSLIPAADYAGPIGEPTDNQTTWHALYVRARPAPVGGEPCSTKPAPDAGTSAAELAAFVAGHPALDATEPAPVAVGALTGTMVDVRLRDDWTGTCPELAGDAPTTPLLAERGGGGWDWGVVEGERQRLIFVDIGGGATVMIAVDDNTSATRFDALVAAAMPIIATFEFPQPE
jgi:hypothetical protein